MPLVGKQREVAWNKALKEGKYNIKQRTLEQLSNAIKYYKLKQKDTTPLESPLPEGNLETIYARQKEKKSNDRHEDFADANAETLSHAFRANKIPLVNPPRLRTEFLTQEEIDSFKSAPLSIPPLSEDRSARKWSSEENELFELVLKTAAKRTPSSVQSLYRKLGGIRKLHVPSSVIFDKSIEQIKGKIRASKS